MITPVPLRDDSHGRLKGWPGGGFISAGGEYIPIFRPARQGEEPNAIVEPHLQGIMYCKYCYEDVQTLLLREIVGRYSQCMRICAECGSGLDLIERARPA